MKDIKKTMKIKNCSSLKSTIGFLNTQQHFCFLVFILKDTTYIFQFKPINDQTLFRKRIFLLNYREYFIRKITIFGFVLSLKIELNGVYSMLLPPTISPQLKAYPGSQRFTTIVSQQEQAQQIN